MRIALVLLCLFFILLQSASCAVAKSTAKSGEEKSFSLNYDGEDRSYIVYSPPRLTKEKSAVLFFLHGGMGNADHAIRNYGLNQLADANSFLMVYPNGIGLAIAPRRRTWNAGSCCGPAQKKNVDDVGYIEQIFKELEKNYSIDKKRIYITGMSNGGMMAYRLMCEKPHLFAAIMPVAGTLSAPACEGAEQVALLHIHGSADESVPYKGGVGKGITDTNFRAIPDSIKIVTQARKCKPPVVKTLPSGDIETKYDCAPNAPVNLYVVAGVGHAWPGSDKSRRSSDNMFNANEEIWHFAKKFSK